MHRAQSPTSFVVILAVLTGFAAGCGGGVSSTRRAPAGAELPVTKVILYQNGIGYFERRGEVAGDVLTLQVRPEQINDMLKSLTVVDTRDGRAVSVSLPLEKRSADRLADLPEQVRAAGGILQVLAVFRGAQVHVHGDEGSVRGRVVGVEPLNGETGGWRLTLKDDQGTLHVYPVEAIEEVELEDKTLSVGLDKSLEVSLDSGNWKPIALSVRLAGSTPHDLIVAYITEMPVWKPSYRVVLAEQKKALLQGWAVIDNVSGEDWNETRLSLVAGNPVSFKYDLHSPQFTSRVDLTPQHRRQVLGPAIERAGVAAAPPPPAPSAAPASPIPSAASAARGPSREMKKSRSMRADDSLGESEEASAGMGMAGPSDYDLASSLESQAPPAATGESVGSLFRYDLRDPVTVPDGTSNLVSIVNARVDGEEVVLFRPSDRDETGAARPYRAVLLKNGTGSILERGPVAIYDGNTFVGEAFVERMEKDTTGFLAYAVDGMTHLTQSQSTSEDGGRLLKITAGMIETEVLSVLKQKLTVENNHGEELVAYVKMPRLGPPWKLTNKPERTIETGVAIFYPVKVPANGKGELELVWQQPIVRRLGIDTDLSTTVLKVYLGSGKVPKEIAGPINEILGLKTKIVENTTEYARLQKQHQQLADDQERVRENLNLLRRTAGNQPLQQQLVDKLAQLEADLGRLSGRMVRLSEDNAEMERKMNTLIRGISLDVSK